MISIKHTRAAAEQEKDWRLEKKSNGERDKGGSRGVKDVGKEEALEALGGGHRGYRINSQ